MFFSDMKMFCFVKVCLFLFCFCITVLFPHVFILTIFFLLCLFIYMLIPGSNQFHAFVKGLHCLLVTSFPNFVWIALSVPLIHVHYT